MVFKTIIVEEIKYINYLSLIISLNTAFSYTRLAWRGRASLIIQSGTFRKDLRIPYLFESYEKFCYRIP